jgi:FtsH-binding integral membrane protein
MHGSKRPSTESAVPGYVAAAAILTGGTGLVLSVVAYVNGQEIGAGLFLLAAAIAFGALVNAFFRS